MLGFARVPGAALWERPATNDPTSDVRGVSAEDGVLYAYSRGAFTAVDQLSGVEIWRDQAGDVSFVHAIPAVHAGNAVVVGGHELVAFDLQSEARRWLIDASFEGLAAIDAIDAFATFDGTIHSYSLETGVLLQVYAGDYQLKHGPIIADDAVIAASDATVFVFNRETGEVTDSIDGGGRLAVANGRLYVSRDSGILSVYRWTEAP